MKVENETSFDNESRHYQKDVFKASNYNYWPNLTHTAILYILRISSESSPETNIYGLAYLK